MRLNNTMIFTGGCLIVASVGVVENGHFMLSMALAMVGFAILFFSEEQHRNPAWIKRQIKYLIWKYCP